ncbi:MAG: c-type cytochrome domain-containing protein [Planctomycetaceae bacterium]
MRAGLFVFVGLPLVLVASSVFAQTPEQRKELQELRKSIGQTSGLIRKKEFEQVKKLFDDADAQLGEIAQAMSVSKSDRKLMGIDAAIEKGRESLEIAWARAEGRPPKLGPSFQTEVAPIIVGKCLGCHGSDNPRAGLDLSTFASWKQPRRSGPLLIPGNPARSLLMMKLTTPNEQQRMPKNEAPLSEDEIRTIAKWVEYGAKFDADNESTPLADFGKPAAKMPAAANVVIPKPTGNETVSFTTDVAPFMANLCVRCHNTNRKSGGLSLETFHDMMVGGDSGRVVLPGNVEGSRLFRLTGGLENPRMPNDNQVRITRQNYDDLKKWFEEGNTFDGTDPKTPLRQYAAAALAAAGDEFTNKTADEFKTYRRTRTEELFKKATPNDSANFYESPEFLVYGNASADRLKQVDDWAQQHLKSLQQAFGSSPSPAWKGRLAIFVFSDRFGYEEFNQVNNNRRAPKEMTAHAVITPNYSDAYVCLQDTGDKGSHETGGLQVALIEYLTAVYLQRDAAKIPDWAVRGAGLAMAASVLKDNAYLRDLDAVARDAVKVVLNPADLFADGIFSPELSGAVGYALVKYMVSNGGMPKFGQFLQALKGGQSAAQAVRSVYSADLNALGRGFIDSLGRGR